MIIKPNQIQAFELPGPAYRWACDLIQRFGENVITEDGQATKEIRNLVLQVESPTVGWPIGGSGWDIPALERYAQTEILSPKNNLGFDYTYGERLGEQIEQVIGKLKEEPNSRRAIATPWLRTHDIAMKHPPCLIVLDFLIRGEALHLTAFFRSHDIKQAWPANVYGLGQLLKHVADEVGVEVGSLTTVSVSAHIYLEGKA